MGDAFNECKLTFDPECFRIFENRGLVPGMGSNIERTSVVASFTIVQYLLNECLG